MTDPIFSVKKKKMVIFLNKEKNTKWFSHFTPYAFIYSYILFDLFTNSTFRYLKTLGRIKIHCKSLDVANLICAFLFVRSTATDS